MQVRSYAEVEPTMINLIRHKAERWHRKGAGDVDDLVQEGRVVLVNVIETFDEQKGKPFHVYLGKCLDFRYHEILRNALTQQRTPHIWELEGTDWRRVPCPTFSLDDLCREPEMTINVDEMIEAKRLLIALQFNLSPEHRRVLECLIRPPPELIATARNMTGSYKVEYKHIAIYLGVTVDTVKYAVNNGIRKKLLDLAKRRAS